VPVAAMNNSHVSLYTGQTSVYSASMMQFKTLAQRLRETAESVRQRKPGERDLGLETALLVEQVPVQYEKAVKACQAAAKKGKLSTFFEWEMSKQDPPRVPEDVASDLLVVKLKDDGLNVKPTLSPAFRAASINAEGKYKAAYYASVLTLEIVW
jgi:hypothetical protein